MSNLSDKIVSDMVATWSKLLLQLPQATTPWFKLDPQPSMVRPDYGEWCLWSVLIDGQRNYFSGRLILYRDTGEERIALDGILPLSVKVDSSVWWARVIHIPTDAILASFDQKLEDIV